MTTPLVRPPGCNCPQLALKLGRHRDQCLATPQTNVPHIPGACASPLAGPILGRCAPARYASGGRVTVLGIEPGHAHVWAADRRDYVALHALSLDLEADLGPTVALRWLARHYGVKVGLGSPRWSYSPAGATSVASWALRGEGTSQYVFCDYPEDIERTNGAPGPDGRVWTNIRNLPTEAIPALIHCCLHAAGL